MSYKVVPFNYTTSPSMELQSIIDAETVNGYEYVNHEYSDKLHPGSSGCFGIGATADTTVHIGLVVFKKK